MAELSGGQGPAGAQIRQFLMERCAGGVCLGGLARGDLDARDAAVSALLTEVAGLLMDCAARCDGELPAFLRARVLPQLQLSPALQVLSQNLMVPLLNAPIPLTSSTAWTLEGELV